VRAYKFLELEGVGVFSRFAWPLPDGGPGAWVESEVDPCRAGVHACRPADLPYWVAPALVESARVGFIAARIAEELGGPDAHAAERERQSNWLVAHLALA
jgi:hypothetical protein